MAAPRLPLLLLLAAALCWRAYRTEDSFDLADALDVNPTKKPDPKPPKKPPSKTGDFSLDDYFDTPSKATTKRPRITTKSPAKNPGDFSLEDYFDTPSKVTTKRPRITTKSPAKDPDQSLWDLLNVATTRSPKTTKPPPRNKPAKDPKDLDLLDALDDQNDRPGGKQNSNTGGGGDSRKSSGDKGADFSDSDLDDILSDGNYAPDKKRGGDAPASDNVAETGTIAGIVSALAMALVGAVGSYISYQQKKFCFNIQQGLNAEYVKGENMEAPVAEEPQVKYTALDMQSAEPPSKENTKV